MALAEEFTLKSHLLQTARAKKTCKSQKQIKGDSFAFRAKGMPNTGDRRQRISKNEIKQNRPNFKAAGVLRFFLQSQIINQKNK